MSARDRLAAAVCAVIALAGVAAQWTLAARDTPTRDEMVHLGAGYAYWKLPDSGLNPEHPPLVKVLAAAPLVAMDVAAPELPPPPRVDAHQTVFGGRLLFRSGNDPQATIAAARRAVLALTGWLPLVAGLFAQLAFGGWAGPLAALLAATCPIALAHGHLVTTDVANALFVCLASLLAWRAVERPGPGPWWGLATTTGLAVATKYSAPFPLAALPLAAALGARAAGRPPLRDAARIAAALATGAGMGICLAWGWPPDPGAWFEGLLRVGANHVPGYRYWAFGSYEEGRPWTYFPAALAVKASPALLAALPLAALARLRARGAPGAPPASSPLAFALLPAAFHLGAMVALAPHLGVRYVLPVLPGLWVAAGAVAGAAEARPLRLAAVAVAVGALGTGVAAHRDPIGYFNGIGGCRSADPVPCLDDSNADWGLGLIRLGEHLESLGPDVVPTLWAFTAGDPASYLLHREMTEPEFLRPYRTVYAVSAQRMARTGVEPEDATWIRRIPPDAVVGGFRVFDLRARADLPEPPSGP